MTDSSIPFFDSLIHPSLDGFWFTDKYNGLNTFSNAIQQLHQANVKWACSVSMSSSQSYNPHLYPKHCEVLSADEGIKLVPIAFIEPRHFNSSSEIEIWLDSRKQLGFKGIKMHPRLGKFTYDHPLLPTIIKSANNLSLIPFLCTYFYPAPAGTFSNDSNVLITVESLRRLLYQVPNEKLILLHGGGVRLLELAEFTRHFKRMMIDVSWSLCEYAGSSLDLDLKYVFDRCRHRVCIGSDSPDYSPIQMKRRFEYLTEQFTLEHKRLIACENLLNYFGLEIC